MVCEVLKNKTMEWENQKSKYVYEGAAGVEISRQHRRTNTSQRFIWEEEEWNEDMPESPPTLLPGTVNSLTHRQMQHRETQNKAKKCEEKWAKTVCVGDREKENQVAREWSKT